MAGGEESLGQWKRRERPLRLELRVEFPDYSSTQGFLDQLSLLSENTAVYPNMSFGRTYVNLTLFADAQSGEFPTAILEFAEAVARFLDRGNGGGDE